MISLQVMYYLIVTGNVRERSLGASNNHDRELGNRNSMCMAQNGNNCYSGKRD